MRNPNIELNCQRRFPKTPPLEWYVGIGTKEGGITVVLFDESLLDLRGGEVGRQLDRFNHYIGNPTTVNDQKERAQRAKEAIEDAEKIIAETTGFSPYLLLKKTLLLTELYKGKKLAPFKVELF